MFPNAILSLERNFPIHFKGEQKRSKSGKVESSTQVESSNLTKLKEIFSTRFCKHSFRWPIILFCLTMSASMSTFYQVLGAVRCPKIKKHAGIKLKPLTNKAKEPFLPNDMLLFNCESTKSIQTIKCLDDGRWNEVPYCPDPANFTCSALGQIPNGIHNASADTPLKFGTVVEFRCNNELSPFSSLLSFPATTTTTTTTTAPNFSTIDQMNIPTILQQNSTTNSSETLAAPLRYNLIGNRFLKCQASSEWNHPLPTCVQVLPEPQSNMSFFFASIMLILISLLVTALIAHMFVRWRKRQQQRERWKQYFTDYKYRHSKTSITFGMRPQSSNSTIPVTDL